MGEINSAQYSSVFPRFLLSLGFHPLGEDAKSCESPWLLVETAFFTPLSVDLGHPLAAFAHVMDIALVAGGGCDNAQLATAVNGDLRPADRHARDAGNKSTRLVGRLSQPHGVGLAGHCSI